MAKTYILIFTCLFLVPCYYQTWVYPVHIPSEVSKGKSNKWLSVESCFASLSSSNYVVNNQRIKWKDHRVWCSKFIWQPSDISEYGQREAMGHWCCTNSVCLAKRHISCCRSLVPKLLTASWVAEFCKRFPVKDVKQKSHKTTSYLVYWLK